MPIADSGPSSSVAETMTDIDPAPDVASQIHVIQETIKNQSSSINIIMQTLQDIQSRLPPAQDVSFDESLVE